MNKQQAIKLICEKRGHEIFPDGWGNCFCEEMEGLLEGKWGDYWLLGFLKSKETLIAVFGEEDVEFEIEVGPEGGTVYDVARLPAFKYHHNQMGHTLEEVLKYYAEYLSHE